MHKISVICSKLNVHYSFMISAAIVTGASAIMSACAISVFVCLALILTDKKKVYAKLEAYKF